jgi:hypothetical protein
MKDEYREVEVNDSGLSEFLRLLATTRANGNTYVHRFRWMGDRTDWFRTGTNLSAFETFRGLLESEAARKAMPDILEPSPFPTSRPPNFAQVPGGVLGLDGDLAALLVLGGAYERFRGPHRAAKDIAREAVHDLIEDRYEDFLLYHSEEPWSSWFFDVAWDQTWILVDKREAEVTVICTTDTD